MFAFRKNIPFALHQKILGVDPQPTTMTALVEKAQSYDRSYRIWGGPNPNAFGHRGMNTCSTTTNVSGEAQINLYEAGDCHPKAVCGARKY